MDMTTATPNRRALNLFAALGLASVIVATEYLTRHFVICWLPVLGKLRVNDMLVSGIGYLVLVWLTVPPERRTLYLPLIWPVASPLLCGTGVRQPEQC
ncbi:MAG: hypothetical protein L0332_06410 [Chloroflexi bacterium]|nr:hypothetical protein [Chloroflexota bacterium]MCI0646538.1 hypothetical protein [Chloroflexota bacterium]MCI0726340.1 hypothetical protein [Chloroflexota bacterium]